MSKVGPDKLAFRAIQSCLFITVGAAHREIHLSLRVLRVLARDLFLLQRFKWLFFRLLKILDPGDFCQHACDLGFQLKHAVFDAFGWLARWRGGLARG